MISKDEAKTIPPKALFLARLIYLIIRLLSFTYRIRIRGNRQALLGLKQRQDALILAIWHNRMFYFATYMYRYLLRQRDFSMAMMSSDSKDGEIGATIGKLAGMNVVRGSSSRRGAAGLMALYRKIVKQKLSIIILPDGSKGPVYKAKVGAVALAKMTGKPILPASCWASSYWRIRSWDRMIIPKPFARIEVVVGQEFVIDRRADDEQLERDRQNLESVLDELGRQAEAPLRKAKGARERLPCL
ncbi:lysophospholipid acyltransferase family protein [Pelagicoccus sp. SDUM812003]|uniref:lysophospholipid acyltransferase family protein n=1 Tax=Pelagicoccus sp. SDUM812003 TaxID=3041267 RepID=UPI00280E62B8|nr:lysophospholipid acyltransferase family protein [Pelagicoccus sp. SDUM812003]MDQ8205341.1 lysophospholipid acyltransferase family protein [Pelagicoccus sp. SDUM812003]